MNLWRSSFAVLSSTSVHVILHKPAAADIRITLLGVDVLHRPYLSS